jgi:hypothetical protein
MNQTDKYISKQGRFEFRIIGNYHCLVHIYDRLTDESVMIFVDDLEELMEKIKEKKNGS